MSTGAKTLSRTFEPAPTSVSEARRFARDVLADWGLDELLDDVVLLTSELVTNAVRHACGPCALVVSFDGDTVELAVEDGDPQVPVARVVQGLEETGRGFLLVGALADAWGVRAVAGGKATWFTLVRSHPDD